MVKYKCFQGHGALRTEYEYGSRFGVRGAQLWGDDFESWKIRLVAVLVAADKRNPFNSCMRSNEKIRQRCSFCAAGPSIFQEALASKEGRFIGQLQVGKIVFCQNSFQVFDPGKTYGNLCIDNLVDAQFPFFGASGQLLCRFFFDLAFHFLSFDISINLFISFLLIGF